MKQTFKKPSYYLLSQAIDVYKRQLLTVFENLEAHYICRNVITVYPDCKSMIDVARQKLMNDPTFKHLSEDCQAYYFCLLYTSIKIWQNKKFPHIQLLKLFLR